MKIYSLESIIKDNSQSPEPIIGNGILLPKSFLLIDGHQKVKKSFLAYNMGIAIASGKSFAIFKIKKQHKVLILAAEGGYYPNRDRIKKMIENIEIQNKSNLDICFDTRITFENDDDYNDIKLEIEMRKPDILIIDPFVRFHHLDENSAKDMAIILGRLRFLIEDYGISIILIHHLGKDSSSGARGSSAISGEYDSCLTISKKEKDMVTEIQFELRHDLSPESNKIIFNANTYWFERDWTSLMKVIEEYGPMNKNDFVNVLLEIGVYESTSGAYKGIDSEVGKGNLYCDEEGIYHIKELDE